MEQLLNRNKDRRDERENEILYGIRFCFPSKTDKSELDPRVVLNYFFLSKTVSPFDILRDSSTAPVNRRNNQLQQNLNNRSREESSYTKAQITNANTNHSNRKSSCYYGSTQALIALMEVYDLEIIISEQLTPDMISSIFKIINGARESKSGFPLSPTDGNLLDDFEIRMSELELCTLENNRDCVYEQDFLHEMFISFYFTNNLRRIIPNFQLCYAGIKASSTSNSKCLNLPESHAGLLVSPLGNSSERISYLSEDSEEFIKSMSKNRVSCACDSSQTVDYLILEKLKGLTMTQALKTCTLNEAVNWLIQIVLAMEMAVTNFGFTHYNLNPDNVVIVPLSNGRESINVKYWHKNKIWSVKCSSIAVIRNFDLAHVKYTKTEFSDDGERIINGSEHFGPYGYEYMGIYHNETRPFYDIYRLVMWMIYITKYNNEKVGESLQKLAKFFGMVYVRDLDARLKSELEFGYIYSSDIGQTEKIRSLADFFLFIIKTFPLENTLSLFGSLTTTMKCDVYCSLNTFDHDIQIELVENPLRLLGVRGCLNRKKGLEKRSSELKRMMTNLCSITNKTCETATEESSEIEIELKEFVQLLKTYGEDLWYKSWTELRDEANEINSLISMLNNSVASFAVTNLNSRGIEDKKTMIQGRLAATYDKIVDLKSFREELGLTSETPTIRMLSLSPVLGNQD